MSNTQSTPIENIVVLMMENRSFDNILGALMPNSSQFEGLVLDGSMSNTYQGNPYPVSNVSSLQDALFTPTPDPGEAFQDMNLQIFGNTDGTGAATMGGFVNDWMAEPGQYPAIPTDKECLWVPSWPCLPRSPDPKTPCKASPSPGDIMYYYTSSGSSPQLPVSGWLAKNFAVSDAWFGSSPTQTFPNRFFVNCGTAGGYVQDVDYVCHFEIFPDFPSIFELLDGGGGPNAANWTVYFHDYPITSMIKYVFESPELVRSFDDSDYGILTRRPTFYDAINNHTLPKYSFIEPRYGGINDLAPNSNHPPHNVLEGEILLANVYNAIAQSEYWERTLLIVTYDEHGGCYDHVVPPAAVKPDGTVLRDASTFGFDRYGPRVPALLISPYIAAGTVLRPEGFAYNPVSSGITTTNGVTPFDHTSVIKTVIECFNLQSNGKQANLTRRDLNAPSLLSALTPSSNLNSPGPVAVPSPPANPGTADTNHLCEIFHAALKKFGV